jgi:hypothetical protein
MYKSKYCCRCQYRAVALASLTVSEWHLRDLPRPESEIIGCETREFQRWGTVKGPTEL